MVVESGNLAESTEPHGRSLWSSPSDDESESSRGTGASRRLRPAPTSAPSLHRSHPIERLRSSMCRHMSSMDGQGVFAPPDGLLITDRGKTAWDSRLLPAPKPCATEQSGDRTNPAVCSSSVWR